jgi:regulator of sirC expression with transglutaminase-like and TPR domain
MKVSSSYRKKAIAPASREEVRALLVLLDDPDPFIREKVEERLSELDESSVPILDECREQSVDPRLRGMITERIHKLTYPSFELEFVEYLESGIDSLEDLERGELLLCRLDNPTLRTDLYRRQLDRMAARLGPSIHAGLTHGEQLQTFVSFFFEKEYFKGAETDYRSPCNSFLHKVLQRRRGIPISLSLVMLFVARRLDLPFHGVNMPMHFLVKYESGNQSTLIDPFNRGRVVSIDQCSYFLRNHGIDPLPVHFERAPERDILARSVRNLVYGYEEEGHPERVAELKRLLGYIVQSGAD